MGIVNFGIPLDETKWLLTKQELDIFVEGGTYQGGTACSMSELFSTVYTIERSDVMYGIAKEKLSGIDNITLLKGDTREHLKNILIDNDNFLFWLDAHWSGGETYGKDDECPLLEELKIIFESSASNYAILIDDARLFLAPPPIPHDAGKWPSIKDIASVIPCGYELIVRYDVLYIVKETIGFRDKVQDSPTDKWLYYKAPSKRYVRHFVRRVVNILRNRINWL